MNARSKETTGEMTSAEMADEADVSLEICVLGDFVVLRKGEYLGLPPSRKTRALLAYLAVVNHPQEREHLCEMFWDVADDPRNALRWSLSKIRQIVNTKGHSALVTDRRTVVLRSQSIALDLWRIKVSMCDLASLEISELEKVARLFRGAFLEDLSLPRCPKFEAWRITGINEVNLFKAQILRTVIDRLGEDASRTLPYALALRAMD